MVRVLIADALAPSAAEILNAVEGVQADVRPGLSEDELISIVGGYDAVLIRRPTRITARVLERGARLKLVGRAGIALDNVDVEAATNAGVAVINTPFGNATTVAEQSVALLFALARHLPDAVASMRRGEWLQAEHQGRQLAGKTLGVIGLGTVGRLVAQRGLGLGMTVVGHDPAVDHDEVQKIGDIDVVSFAELFHRADFVTLHVPLTPRTRHFISEAAFVAMKRGAYLVNCARGGLVDEKALLAALDEGELAGAALDVFEDMPLPADHALRRHPKVITTPHLSAQTPEALEAVSRQIAEQTRDFFIDGVVTHAVNLPALTKDQVRRLAPHRELAQRLGLLAAQLHPGPITEIRLAISGDLDPDDVEPLRNSALASLVSKAAGRAVNEVSAAAVAQAAGIRIIARARDGETDFSNLIRLDLAGPDGGVRVEGAVFGRRELRVVGIDRHRLDLVPSGHILAIRNANVPGVIGAVGSLLGARGINVARLGLGLGKDERAALALWCTDVRADDDVVEALGQLDGVLDIRRLELP